MFNGIAVVVFAFAPATKTVLVELYKPKSNESKLDPVVIILLFNEVDVTYIQASIVAVAPSVNAALLGTVRYCVDPLNDPA